MKMLFAGFVGSPYAPILYNCNRNKACQPEYFMPVKTFDDVVLYLNFLGGEPDTYELEIFNACDLLQTPGTVVAGDYVVGTKPDGQYYGVFGGLVVTPPVGVTYKKFFFRMTVHIGLGNYVYYSEMYDFEDCLPLTFLRGCYPNEPVGSEATDCNGIYYGFPNNDTPLGSPNYRYIHKAYVRDGSMEETENSLQFVAFKSRRTYRSTLKRTLTLMFELVPAYYKNILMGIFARGNVQVSNSQVNGEYKLADDQTVSVNNVDSKMWMLDMTFDSECKQHFGCEPSDCVLPPETCCDPVIVDAEVVNLDCTEPGSDATLPEGEVGETYAESFFLTGSLPMVFGDITYPPWLIVTTNGTTGEVNFDGIPNESGTFEVTIEVTNCDGEITGILQWQIDIAAEECTPVAYASGLPFPEATVGVPYSHQVFVTGDPTFTLGAFLPAGLTASIDPDTGTVTVAGTPTTEGPATMEVIVSNCEGANSVSIFTDPFDVQPGEAVPDYFTWNLVGEIEVYNSGEGLRSTAVGNAWNNSLGYSVETLSDGETVYGKSNNLYHRAIGLNATSLSFLTAPGWTAAIYAAAGGTLYPAEGGVIAAVGEAVVVDWVRLRYESGEIFYEYSADGISWTLFHTVSGVSGSFRVLVEFYNGDPANAFSEIYKLPN